MSSFFIDSVDKPLSLGALALGSFDGVHLGHQKLIGIAQKESELLSLPSAVLSFFPHPKSFFSTPDKPFFQIYSNEQNIKELKSFGVDHVLFKKFDKICSDMTAFEFLEYIYSKLKFETLVVGFDFRFGKNRDAGLEALKKWSIENQVKLKVVNKIECEDQKISSTRIKEFLFKPDLDKVKQSLARPYKISGLVYADQGLGRKIGFPTLNLKLDLNTAICRGVYSSFVHFNQKKYKALSNIGLRPTVSNNQTSLALETHILDLKDIEIESGDFIEVEFLKFIRPEKKFATIAELRDQIEADIASVKVKID
jgi:riboflavin kinase/FMN adenylyltransferase